MQPGSLIAAAASPLSPRSACNLSLSGLPISPHGS
uniref:Uncharacterized protein n=1 Tax=Siphoviridae sp. ctLkp13 TaxID=2826252 RepID=A0A8S5LT66_9CAUD|nr:MAG TPA: hypothetical protein [Siphoviridae sp. ctLkp13]